MDTNKKLIARIGGVFVAILLFLTFFSSTIYNFNLPGVVVEYPRQGVLTNYAEGRGIVEFARMELHHAEGAGRITLLVSEGETVTAGSELYFIESDIEDLRKSLDERLQGGERLEMRTERARADLQHARNSLANLKNEAGSGGFDAPEYDYEIQRIQALIGAAERELGDLEALFELGAASQREIDDMEYALGSLALQLQQQQDRKQRALESYNRAVEAGARELESRRAGIEKAVADCEFQIGDLEFETAANRQEIDRLKSQIDAGGRIAALAGSGGAVREIRAGLETGAHVGKNDLIMRVGAADGGFRTTVDLPESVDFLNVGDPVTLRIRSRDIYGLGGEVSSLAFFNGRLRTGVAFDSENVGGGETVEVTVQSTSQLYDLLVPVRALRSDQYGDYILYAEKSRGALGDEFIARKNQVRVLGHDSHNAAIIMFSSDDRLAIIVSSDKGVSDGDRVRIVDGSDIVAIK